MRVDSSNAIAGQPALIIRKLLRKGYGKLWGISFVKNVLDVDLKTAKRIIVDLESEGYIEKRDLSPQGYSWENTIKSNAF